MQTQRDNIVFTVLLLGVFTFQLFNGQAHRQDLLSTPEYPLFLSYVSCLNTVVGYYGYEVIRYLKFAPQETSLSENKYKRNEEW